MFYFLDFLKFCKHALTISSFSGGLDCVAMESLCFQWNRQNALFSFIFLLGLSKRQTISQVLLFFCIFCPPLILRLFLPLPPLYPAGMAGVFTPNWSGWRPLSEPFSRSTSGRRTWPVNGALCAVFLRGGPLSPTLICHRSLSVHTLHNAWLFLPQSPGSRPDLNKRSPAKFRPWFLFLFHSQRDSELLLTVRYRHFVLSSFPPS